MKFASKYDLAQPKDGEVKLLTKFAYWPIFIAGFWVWLERFEVLQVYRITEQKVTIDEEIVIFLAGKWINLANRCK